MSKALDVTCPLDPTPAISSHASRDQAELEAFLTNAWQGTRFPFDPAGAHADVRRLATEYQSNGGGFWILRLQDTVIGTVGLRRLPDGVGEVKRLAVLPQQRGRGHGQRLLRHALEHARRAGFERVRLDTARSQVPALRLFEKHGFSVIARYNENADAEVFMQVDLRSTTGGPGHARQASEWRRSNEP